MRTCPPSAHLWPGALPTRKRGKLAGQPTGPAGLLTIRHAHSPIWCGNGNGIYGNGVAERQYGHGFTETYTDDWKRKVGNQALAVHTDAVSLGLAFTISKYNDEATVSTPVSVYLIC